MVLRSTRSRGVAGVVRDQSDRTDDLARRQGRGNPALRNGANHVLELDPGSSVPRLVPRADGTPLGTSLRFGVSSVEVRDDSDSEPRDFIVRNLRVTGNVMVDGTAAVYGLTAAGGGVRAEGVISARDRMAVDSGFTNGPIATSGKPFLYAANENVGIVASQGRLFVRDNFDTAYGPIYDSKQPASERALKDHQGDLDNALEVVETWRAARWSWRDDSPYADGREHAGVYVDEIADSAPEAVAGLDLEGNRVPDDRALIGYLVASVQQLAAQNRVLSTELGELRNAVRT